MDVRRGRAAGQGPGPGVGGGGGVGQTVASESLRGRGRRLRLRCPRPLAGSLVVLSQLQAGALEHSGRLWACCPRTSLRPPEHRYPPAALFP